MSKTLIKDLPSNQFEMLRELAIDLANNSSSSVDEVISAMQLDVDMFGVAETIFKWSDVAKKQRRGA
jgi:hypothetical protein